MNDQIKALTNLINPKHEWSDDFENIRLELIAILSDPKSTQHEAVASLARKIANA